MSSFNQYPPLELAKLITNRVNDAWEEGSFLASVTPTTRNLLTYWFGNSFCEQRQVNFHAGQCQAIKKYHLSARCHALPGTFAIFMNISARIYWLQRDRLI